MYRIGEFSYLCSMSIKTLRYYDKIGVLIPASVDELTGYRYYDIDQLEQAQKIKSLQEASFTLEEIKAILKEKNTDGLLTSLINFLESFFLINDFSSEQSSKKQNNDQ